MTNKERIASNNALIDEAIDKANSLPDASNGVELPDLTEPASEDEVFLNQEYIDENGEKKTGTFTIESELSMQDSLITQLQNAIEEKGTSLQPNKDVTPSTTQQIITADSGYNGLSQVTIEAIPSTYVKPTATKSATIYTPTTTDQTIAAGTYCSGAQIIKGDANLIPANIVSGRSIFGVSGTATAGGESGGSGGSGITVSVTNNLPDLLIVNGCECPVGETTSNIPYDNGYISFVILTLDETGDIVGSYLNYCGETNAGYPIFDPIFGAYGEMLYEEDVIDWENCHPLCGVVVTYGDGSHNIAGILASSPWDYINDIPLNNANIEFMP